MPDPIDRLMGRWLNALPDAPKPIAAVPPEENPHRWMVPDKACIDRAIAVVPDADKKKYKLVADLVTNQLFVVDRQSGEAVDAYLTSPGEDEHPTKGDRFTIRRVMPMAWWNPPTAEWAEDEKPTPPGLGSPTGVLKLDLGQYAQLIHGTPKANEKRLGQAVSHGCLRMSNANVVHLYQNYARVGTVVDVNRDPDISLQLKSDLALVGRTVHRVRDGQELVQPLIDSCGPNQ